MNLPEDFKEFIELLNAHQVEYLIVGGYAVGFHSRPKFTNDIDIWINKSEENAHRMLTVLEDFGFGSLEINLEDFTANDRVIQLGHAPLRIDVMTSISGVEFSEAYKEKMEGIYLGIKTFFISLDQILQNKKASGREKDLQDIKWLKKYSKPQ